MPINLGSGAISAAYVGSTAVAAAYIGSSSVYTAGGGGITPNTDAIARLYLPAATTSLTIGVMTSSGFWYMTDGTNTSSIAGGNYSAAVNQNYAYQYNQSNNKTTLSGMSPSASKVVQIISCNSSGTPTGDIRSIQLVSNSSDIDAVDISGLGLLYSFAAFSSGAYTGNFVNYNNVLTSSSLPSSITEIRAVGTTIAYSGTGVTTYYSQTRYWKGGLDISGQLLDASALDQLYSDLGDATAYTGTNALKVRGNPGVSGDTPTIATGKNYTVYGS
ncbi:MAG: hypothetical protein ACO3LD_07570 [Luminiphilus sp.]